MADIARVILQSLEVSMRAVVQLFAIIGIGFGAAHFGVLDAPARSKLAKLSFALLSPIFMLSLSPSCVAWGSVARVTEHRRRRKNSINNDADPRLPGTSLGSTSGSPAPRSARRSSTSAACARSARSRRARSGSTRSASAGCLRFRSASRTRARCRTSSSRRSAGARARRRALLVFFSRLVYVYNAGSRRKNRNFASRAARGAASRATTTRSRARA